jgi:hypothetical protein
MQRCEAALVLARRAVEQGKGSQGLVSFQIDLGMAEYRSGHFAEVDAALTRPRIHASNRFDLEMGTA